MGTKQIKLTIPSSMHEISLGRYQRFVLETDVEDITEEVLSTKILDIFLDIKESDAYKMSAKGMLTIADKMSVVLNQKPTLIQRFKMGDTEFGMIPKLDDMSFGEYVDLDTYISSWENMHKAMAVLFRPIKVRKGDKYKIYDYQGEEFWDVMKQMPLSVVMGAMVFFYRLENDLVKNSKTYSQETKTEVDSVESGVGINHSTN